MPAAMAIALMLFGLVFVIAFLSDFRAALRSSRYLKTDGILRRSWIEQSKEFNSSRELFMPMVVYEYTAGGKKYVGRRITTPVRSMRHRIDAEAALAAYAKTTPLGVWYDPDDPACACLKKTPAIEASFPVVFGGLMLAGGALGLVAALS